MSVTVMPMQAHQADAVLSIYQAGIGEGNATFETQAPAWSEFDASKLPAHRFVALDPGGSVTGWVAVSPTSTRAVYAGVVEHSVYVDPAARGGGVGAALLRALISSTGAAGIWTIQAGIFPENEASRRLHEIAGFRTVGVRERLAQINGLWRDVILIERRAYGLAH